MGGEEMIAKVSNNKLKFDVIELPNVSYIKTSRESYSSLKADNYIINGEKPESTHKADWFSIKGKIETVQKLGSPTRINHRYELKSGYPVSDLTPQTITGSYLPDEYENVAGLYTLQYDTVPAELEDYEFEINVVAQRNKDFSFPKSPLLKAKRKLTQNRF